LRKPRGFRGLSFLTSPAFAAIRIKERHPHSPLPSGYIPAQKNERKKFFRITAMQKGGLITDYMS
jgi:hypothetical protein